MARKRLSGKKNFNQKHTDGVPEKPGVYVISSKSKVTQYVGMSGNMQERLQDHLTKGDVKAADQFQVLPASGESEAAKLEEAYIKRLKPKQNKMGK